MEIICLARKPISEKTIAENCLKWGTGGLNIDGSRVGDDIIKTNGYGDKGFVAQENYEPNSHQGRFPANVILDEEAGKMLDLQSGVSKGNKPGSIRKGEYKSGWIKSQKGTHTRQGYNDIAGASKFFYCAKASKKERDMGCEDIPETIIEGRDKGQDERNVAYKKRPTLCANTHPTVKPIKLMTYLIKLITPPNGVVLDPFMGSGSTGVAAKELGFDFIGCELSEEYMKIAEARMGIKEVEDDFWKS
jgi:site-specific DNA-methyltransferase (adenine-specific)